MREGWGKMSLKRRDVGGEISKFLKRGSQGLHSQVLWERE